MATIVGIEADGGAVLAGDRLLEEAGTVRSEDMRHVFDFGPIGAAAVGDAAGVDEFERRLDAEVRSYETEQGESMRVDRLATTAAEIAQEAGVEAVVVTRDDDGAAALRAIGLEGSVLTDETVAFGSGAQLALGVLEDREEDIGLDDATDLAREAVETAAERDSATGEDVDTYRLASDGD